METKQLQLLQSHFLSIVIVVPNMQKNKLSHTNKQDFILKKKGMRPQLWLRR